MIGSASKMGLGHLCALLLALGLEASAAEQPTAAVTVSVDRFMVVDCLLPGVARRIGTRVTYLTARRPVKVSAGDCEIRGGEYVAYNRASLDAALKVWLEAANAGDPQAQTYVGEIYEKGVGGAAPDYTKAQEWYRKAVEKSYPRALMNLGFLYERGLGVNRDMQSALDLYRKASGLGGLIVVDQPGAVAPARDGEADKLRRELEEVKSQLDKANRELERRKRDTESEVERWKQEKQKAEAAGNAAAAKQYEQQLRQREDELERRRQQVRELEQSLTGYRDQLARAESQTATLRRQLEQANSRLAEANREIEERKAKAGADARIVEAIKAEIAKLREQSASADQRAQVQALERELQAKQDEAVRQAQQLARLQQEGERYREQVRTLEAQQAENASLKRELEQANTRLAVANQEIEQRKAQASAEARAVEAIKSELAKLQTQAAASADQRAQTQTLERELKKKQDEAQSLGREIGRLEQEAQGYKEQLKALEVKQAPQVGLSGQKDALVAIAPPSIQLIDPPIVTTRGASNVRLRGAVLLRDIVGRVTAPAGLMSFTVNDKSEPVDAGGMFKSQVRLSKGPTPVNLVAVDGQGRRAQLDFTLVPEELYETYSNAPKLALRGLDFGNYHALVIGNANYQHLAKLDTAAEDARAVGDVLQRKYGFKVTTMIDATRYQILSELNKLRARLTEKDNLLVYYAGHGELDRANLRGHWLPVDAERDSDANWISSVAVTDILNAMSVKHILVVADSCYAGAMTRNSIGQLEGGLSDEARVAWLKALAQARCRTVLTSGGVQPVIDGGGGKHSIFAKSLLEVLERNDELLEAQRLYREVAARVVLFARSQNLDQQPEYAPLKFAGHESGDFLFVPAN